MDLVALDTKSKHVHDVYNTIATQWHHMRGKQGILWPGVSRFLESLPKGSIVADIGYGDGKYFPVIWASDSSMIRTGIIESLLKTAVATTYEGNDTRKGSLNRP